jgi:starch-binding outer membrane protein SusE/F
MRIFKNIIFLFIVLAIVSSCEKEDNRAQFEGGTPPSLTGSRAIVRLTPATENEVAIVFNWTNPNYRFNTGTSSQDVSYSLEIDTMGANFNSPNKYVLSVSKDLSKTFTESELNNVLGNSMLLPVGRQYNLQARVVASIGGSAATRVVSNTWNFRATPFNPPPKVEPPANGTLWITGDAVASGWTNTFASPYDVNQKFTRISNTLYELVLNMPGGGGYKLLQQQGDWASQYHMMEGGTWAAGDFEKRDADPAFAGPPEAGTYKITVNFQTGKYTVVKQ